jgi:hypothetical protein
VGRISGETQGIGSCDTQWKPVSSSCMKSLASLNAAGLPRENALVQALRLSSWRPELPAVRHHSHTFPTRSYTREGRANTFAEISEPPPQPAPWTLSIDRAGGSKSPPPACHSHPALRSVLSGGTIPRGQRRPRSRIAKPEAPIAQRPRPTDAATHDDGVEIAESGNTGASFTTCERVKAKGQQADLVCSSRTLNWMPERSGAVGSWRLLPRPAAPRIDARAQCVTRGLTSSPSAGCVGCELIGEHARTARRDVVAAVNLVGLDPEPLAGEGDVPIRRGTCGPHGTASTSSGPPATSAAATAAAAPGNSRPVLAVSPRQRALERCRGRRRPRARSLDSRRWSTSPRRARRVRGSSPRAAPRGRRRRGHRPAAQ